jgi:hypothetical protein
MSQLSVRVYPDTDVDTMRQISSRLGEDVVGVRSCSTFVALGLSRLLRGCRQSIKLNNTHQKHPTIKT